jgi:hypothetical protein
MSYELGSAEISLQDLCCFILNRVQNSDKTNLRLSGLTNRRKFVEIGLTWLIGPQVIIVKVMYG